MKAKIIGVMVTILTTVAVLAIGASTNSRSNGQAIDEAKSWGPISEGYQLSASVAKDRVAPGEPIVLKLVLRNTTPTTLYLTEVGVEKEYKVKVKDERGEDVPLTKHGKLLRNTELTYFMMAGLAVGPGQEREDSLRVSDLHDMGVGGTYSITVKRMVPKRDGKGNAEVTSNTLKVRVVEVPKQVP